MFGGCFNYAGYHSMTILVYVEKERKTSIFFGKYIFRKDQVKLLMVLLYNLDGVALLVADPTDANTDTHLLSLKP